jgi:hypothetical protein
MSELPPMLILQARAEALAILFAAGEITLGEALAPLEQYVDASGLLEDFGRDAVDRVIVEPFEPFLLIPGV